jgi:6-phosphogluconolactonase (cycloisomerase 2 family)
MADRNNGRISRRQLLKESVAFAMFYRVLRPALGQGRRTFAYVGTYTGRGGNGKGIYLFDMKRETGELRLIKLAAETSNPSWLSLDPSGRYLYAINEDQRGSVSAFAVNRENGDLQPLNEVSSEGAGPAHLSVDPTGKYVFVANYGGGSIAVLPILATGGLGTATYTHQDVDSVGPKIATTAPPGSFAFDGHNKPDAHMIHADPGGRFVLYADLGQDRIYISSFDHATGKLSPLPDSPFVALAPGDGPRHFTFHRNGRWLYSTQEEASTVAFFHFDPQTGSLHLQQTLSTLPPEFKGSNFTSEILLSPDGQFLYVANRLKNTVAFFSLQRDGRLQYIGETSTMGDYPRNIAIDPGGDFLFACNHRSDDVTSFRVDKKTGRLTFTGQYTAVGSPACITFLG